MTLFRRHVHSIAKTNSTGLIGDVTLSEGSNITLTQTGQDISISSTGGGAGTVTWNEDGSLVVTSSTLNILEPDGVALTNTTGTATLSLSKYAFLSGRSGGQTLIGGTAANNILTLHATSSATKGTIDLDDKIRIWPSVTSLTAADVFTMSPSVTHSGGLVNWFNISPTETINAVASITRIFSCGGTWSQSGSSLFNIFNMFYSSATLQSTDSNIPPAPLTFYNQTSLNIKNAVGNNAAYSVQGYTDQGSIVVSAASAAATIGSIVSYKSIPVISSTNASAAITLNSRIGFYVGEITSTTTGTVVITNNIGINIDDMVQGTSGTKTVTNVCGINSELTSGTNKFFIDSDTAASRHEGLFQLGSRTGTPSNTLHLKGDPAVITFDESSATPSAPTSGTQVNVYMKTNAIVFQYQDGATTRYKYLTLSGTGVTWTHSTTAP